MGGQFRLPPGDLYARLINQCLASVDSGCAGMLTCEEFEDGSVHAAETED